MEDKISITCLMKLPSGGHLAVPKLCTVEDMDGKKHTAIVWAWSDRGDMRIADFDVQTGEYLGDRINLPK